MNTKTKSSWATALSIGFTAFAAHAGGGFATGNQANTNFVSLGWVGVFSALLAMVLLALSTREAQLLWNTRGCKSYKDLFSALYHPYDKLHLTFDVFYDIMILMVVASCIAGAASALQQYLGVNYHLGALVVGVVILFLSIFGADLVRMGSSYMGLAILTFDVFYDIMILMVVASCIAGAASALQQYLGVNYHLGALVVGVVILFLSIFGADLVRMGSSYMGLAILALSLVIYFYGLMRGVNLFDTMKASFQADGFSNVPKALFNGVNYAAFQWVTIPGVLACGTVLKTKKDCTRGMSCMLLFNVLGLGLSVLMLTAWSGYFTTVTGGTTLPTLTVLMSLDMNWLVVLYCLVLFLCMISSGVVVVFGFVNRFENASYLQFMKNTHVRRGVIATAIMCVSMFISFAGLTNIVKYGYGYCGYWAIVFVIVPLLTVGAYKNRRFLKGLPDEDAVFESAEKGATV